MKKREINVTVDEICNSNLDKREKSDSLKELWGDLLEERERKYFTNRVFKKLGYFPEDIYLVEEYVECCSDYPERSFAQSILDASKRKNKKIK